MKQINKDILVVTWCTEDVLSVRPDLTNTQARDVLRAMECNHDACIGVNWEVIEYWAQERHPKPSIDFQSSNERGQS